MEEEVMSIENVEVPLRSQEKLLDAEAIELAASTMTRPTARMHLESLAKKLRKEGEALQRVEKSKQAMDLDEKKQEEIFEASNQTSPVVETLDTQNARVVSPSSTPVVTSSGKYVSIDRFSFDAGGYNAPFVTVYVTLNGVGSINRDQITCQFQSSSFDLIVKDLEGKSYRLYQDNLEKDIDPSKSKIIVKSNKIIVKLAKVKQSEYGGYDYWTKLSDKKSREQDKKMKDNPQSSIMDLMKKMYDEGDDNMKKIIGETMLKQQRGELSKDDPMKDLDKMDY